MNTSNTSRNLSQGGIFYYVVAFLILAIVQQFAHATNYYVNSELGNDSWNGKLPVAAGSSVDGPWQTLARLSTVSLLPGDTVYLACGSTWNETLRLASSGSSAAPITISAGPGSCNVSPAIEGAVAIPSNMWKQYSGAIYQARLPIEYIHNSGLSENLNGWSAWSPGNDASMSLDSVCSGSPLPCMQFVSGTGTGSSVAISNNFPLTAGMNYSVSALVKAPAGTRLRFAIRRGGPTYESLGLDQFVTASGTWQTVSFDLRSARSAPNARLDIEVPNGQVRVNIRETHVRRVLPVGDVTGVYVDRASVRTAHHPNFGRTDTDPDSPYASVATSGGKTTLDTMGLAMPGNASLTPGLGVSIRTDNFMLEERRVSAVSGSRLTLDQQTHYSIKPGYGYFLTGALWMLDSPGEWYFNPSTGDLYVWMPDGAAPDGRVSLNTLSIGADLKNKAYVDLIGLNIAHVGTGAQLSTANTVRLRNVAISEISGYGIEADSSRSCAVEWSSIAKTGLDAIKANGGGTKGFMISDSSVTDSGSLARTDGWRKLPRPARAAINVGPNATISRNQMIGSANNGMFLGEDSTVENNRVSRACRVLNDCGGIYTNFAGPNASIVGNVVDTIGGGLHGDLAKKISQTAGIYLDDHAHDVKVVGNTVTGAAYGVLIHNAYNSTVSGNLIFGNNRYQIWMQEDTATVRANGDIYGNRIESNQLVPVAGGPSVFMESYIGDTGDFAVFSNSHYSALLSPRPIGESWPTGNISYNFTEWQASGQDTGGRVSLPVGYASFLSKGGNIVPNGNLVNNRTGWTWWNLTPPYGQIALLNCNFGPCLQLTAGATATILSSPNFSVTAQQWYRVSFDAATSNAGQPISVLVRRGGGGSANYDAVVPGPESFPGSTDWRRYSFVFQSAQTIIADDAATGELGARVDFEGIQPGSSITVARLEVVPLTRSEAAMQLRLQLNPSSSSANIPCSPQDEAAGLCDKFVYLTNGSAVNWSSAVEPLSGHAIYSLDTSLVDTDGDGVADVQDACPQTPSSVAVDSRGCGFDQ